MVGKVPCDLGGLDALLLAKGELLRRQAHFVPLRLRSLDDRQDGAEALVLNDRALASTTGKPGGPRESCCQRSRMPTRRQSW